MPTLLAMLLAAGSARAARAETQVSSAVGACPEEGDLFVGDAVVHVSRGPGRVACRSARSSDSFGVCLDEGGGHDNYKSCTDSGSRPSFCGEKSLWFAHCKELERATPLAVPGTNQRSSSSSASTSHGGAAAVGNRSSLCGCSWSTQHGCVVSGEQTIASLTNPLLVERHCAKSPNSAPCELRKQVMQTAMRFEHCLQLPPASCRKDRACQWGAQGANQCGIDEEKFVLELVGEKHRSHPLVRMIQLHDRCNQLSEESCEGEGICMFDTSMTVPRCDVQHSVVASIMLANPRLVVDMQRSTQEAFCESASQALKGTCPPEKCVDSAGVCSPKQMTEKEELRNVQDIFEVLCSATHDGCPQPCVRTFNRPSGNAACEAPEFTAERIRRLPVHPSDRPVTEVVTLLTSSNMAIEMTCGQADRPLCQAAAPVCQGASAVPSWARDAQSTGAAQSPSLGLKGILAKAARAISDGKAGDFMDDFLSNNPEAVPELTSAFAERFKHLWDKPAEESSAMPPGTKPSMVAPNQRLSNTSSLEQSQEFVSRARAARIGTKLMNPWFVAAGATIVAAICTGLALGALCRAGLLKSQTRELGGALLAADRDLPEVGTGGTADAFDTPSDSILADAEASKPDSEISQA